MILQQKIHQNATILMNYEEFNQFYTLNLTNLVQAIRMHYTQLWYKEHVFGNTFAKI